MNSRERFLAALRGERPDRTPLAHVAALTTVQLQETTGCFMPDVHHDAERLATLLAANHEILGFDAVTFLINYFNEPAALGCRMNWGGPKELPIYLSHPWAETREVSIPKDLTDREPIKTCLRTLRIAKSRYGGRMAVMGKVMGPFSMVQVMLGLENTMVGLINEPERIRYLLAKAVEILTVHGNAQFEAGIDALAIGEGGAGSQMLSPAMHESFLLGAHRQLIENLRGPVIMHICGNITPRMRILAKTGMDCFNFDWAIRPALMKEAAAGKFRIMGNVNTTDLLRGSPERIEEQVRECMEAGVDIVSPGCAVSPECPNENLQAMARALGSRRDGSRS